MSNFEIKVKGQQISVDIDEVKGSTNADKILNFGLTTKLHNEARAFPNLTEENLFDILNRVLSEEGAFGGKRGRQKGTKNKPQPEKIEQPTESEPKPTPIDESALPEDDLNEKHKSFFNELKESIDSSIEMNASSNDEEVKAALASIKTQIDEIDKKIESGLGEVGVYREFYRQFTADNPELEIVKRYVS